MFSLSTFMPLILVRRTENYTFCFSSSLFPSSEQCADPCRNKALTHKDIPEDVWVLVSANLCSKKYTAYTVFDFRHPLSRIRPDAPRYRQNHIQVHGISDPVSRDSQADPVVSLSSCSARPPLLFTALYGSFSGLSAFSITCYRIPTSDSSLSTYNSH